MSKYLIKFPQTDFFDFFLCFYKKIPIFEDKIQPKQ